MRLYPTAVNKFLESPTSSIRAESSRQSMRNTVRLFQQAYPNLELHELTARHLEDWLGGRLMKGVAHSTVKKNLQRLRTFLDWCSWQKLIPANPTEHIEKALRLRPQPVRTSTWLGEDQVRLILDSLHPLTIQDQRDALILRLGFTAGLRNNEIRTLPLSSLTNIEDQQVTIVGKGGRLAQVWVPRKTAELLTAWRDLYQDPRPTDPVVVAFRDLQHWTSGERILTPQWGSGISQQALGRIVAQRTAAAGFKVAPHDMRRSYAGMMEQKVGVVETSKALRHSQISTTQIYLERRQDAAYQAARSAAIDL